MRFPSAGVAMCTLLISAACWAQATVVGNWRATFPGPDGSPRNAKVVLTADGGTWQIIGGLRSLNPCVGRETPASASEISEDGFKLNLFGSKTMRGCDDLSLSLKRVDDKTYAGKMGDGRPVSLTRE